MIWQKGLKNFRADACAAVELLGRPLVVSAVVAFWLSGCRMGGDVASVPEIETTKAVIDLPVVTAPAKNPHYSKTSTLHIEGLCKEGYRVELRGLEQKTTSCVNSKYSFTVQKDVDGIYSFLITQYNSLDNPSQPFAFVWYRKTSIAPPVIESPVGALFKSATDLLTLSGSCESAAKLKVSGGATAETVCENSRFSIPITKMLDGEYALTLAQEDEAGNTAAVSLTWRKAALRITPDLSSAVVGTSIPLTFSGGSEVYSLTIPENNSGGSFNSVSNSYIVGTVAGLSDRLRLTDSNGSSIDAFVETRPDVPDHLDIDSTAPSSAQAGTNPVEFKAKVVDRYGNPIANYPVNFRTSGGGGLIVGSSRAITNASGFASVQVALSSFAVGQRLSVSPLSGVLPDVAGSGRAKLNVQKAVTSTATGVLGAFYKTGQAPGKFVVHDFDGDGKSDVAVLNVGDPSVGILRSKGGGMFHAMTKVQPLCLSPNGILKGDFNSDSRTDLVVICGSTDRIGFIRGRADGGFDLPTYTSIVSTVSLPVGFVSHDFNGDGNLDLAVAGANTSSVGIWMGTGSGSFTQGADFSVGVSPGAIAAADVNQDNKMDLIVTSVVDSTVSTYLGNGSGGFALQNTYPTGGTPIEIVVDRFNGDTWPDFAVVNSSTDNVSVYLNDLSGGFVAHTPITAGSGPSAALSLDFNSDGKRDFALVNNADNTFIVYTGQGNGDFIAKPPGATGGNPIALMATDMNGDGREDLLVVNNGDQNLQFIPKQANNNFGFSTTVGAVPVSTEAWDFNKDGKPDLAVLNNLSSSLTIRYGEGNGLFATTGTDLSVPLNSVHLTVADINADTWLDLLVTSKDANAVRRFFGSASGFVENTTDLTVGNSPTSAAVSDFNGDGLQDIAAANGGGNSISVLLADGSGDYLPRVDTNTSGDPRSIRAVDINNDQHVDLLVAGASVGVLGVMLGNGDGSFQNVVDYAAGPGAMDLVVEDFNADGVLDVAILNATDGTVSVMLNAGNGSFPAKSDYFASATPSAMDSLDYDGDGKLDLVFTGGAAFGFSVLEGGTLGQFNNSVSYVTNYTTDGLFAADLNGDGAGDLILLSGGNSSAEVWMGH